MASNTYSAVGNALDIINIITNIAPHETPLFNMLSKTTATARIHENPIGAGTARPLIFDLINNALEDTWNAGGKPSVLLVSPRNKRVISTFTNGNTKYMDGNNTHKLTQYIDVLETDFGVLKVRTDRFMPNDTVYGLSPEFMRKAFLSTREFKVVDLPKISDMHRKSVFGEWTLEMRAEKAHFMIKDLDGIVPVSA